jgi:hypothetical protein
MGAKLREQCYLLARQRIFQPWLLLSLLSLAMLVAASIFYFRARTELLLMPCVLAIWLLFALAFRLTFYHQPEPITRRGIVGWFRRLARSVWQHLVLLFVMLMAAICLFVSLRLIGLLLKFYLD